MTVRVALLLVAEPAELEATTEYVPASPAAALAIEKEALVAPAIFELSLRHWKVGAGVPLAAAVKVTALPAVTVWPAGWVVKTGGALLDPVTVMV